MPERLRLLLDENIPAVAARLLAERHNALWVAEFRPGIPDDEVLSLSIAQERLLITFDKDFGELVFRRGKATPLGVVLFRVPGGPPDVVADLICHALESRQDWAGHFSVIEETRIRMIPLG